MLTMPKLIAAVIVAFIGWVVSGLVKVEILAVHDSYNFGWLVPLSILLGFLCGWQVLGRRATGTLGVVTAASIGLTAVAAMVFWVLLLMTSNEMLRLAIGRRFDGLGDALSAMVPVARDYGQYLVTKTIIWTLAIGGMIAGVVADWAARRWR
ncbi:TrgA family protein [Pseudooceanicola sp.]|uniref:TrgA family protein n=1 Tax=Pseudooceanicola sp. TaxID=1914328 RepID=UPI0026293F86|nr:TrgA family protein [Pseudooceanicola sp.]MDF1854188.1 TrgA family protein [Pseudooceanicola sp.]